ncbi:hypothetical protein [Antarcticibacterium sp. 1MA-6-2]|uniref:hypothetical protein n=1 Tax=Antarcticibacterium sp. 1MA-6-2 TaxID=2908210 RepID=UPI0028830BEB|nr:hypothetical protein [Antarcticibacterium sp. 1MA-6-2]
MNRLKPSLVRQIFVLFVIAFLGFLIFKEIVPFLSGILGAITLYVILKKWMSNLVARGWKKTWAAVLLMVASFIGILVLSSTYCYYAFFQNWTGHCQF